MYSDPGKIRTGSYLDVSVSMCHTFYFLGILDGRFSFFLFFTGLSFTYISFLPDCRLHLFLYQEETPP